MAVLQPFPLKDLQTPEQEPGTFTDEQIKSLCAKFSSLGLDCELNTPEKMRECIAEVKEEIRSRKLITKKRKVYVASPKNGAKMSEFTMDNSNESFTKMKAIVQNLEKVKEEKLHHVETLVQHHSLKGTIPHLIVKALAALGIVLSRIKTRSVDSGQIMSIIEDFVLSSLTVSGPDLEGVQDKALFFFAKPRESETHHPAICGMLYHFEMKIDGYSDKTSEIHFAKYSVKQQNVYFNDKTAFDNLFMKITKA